jgi:hypothetical protein
MNHFSVVAGEQNAVAESVRTSKPFYHILGISISTDSPLIFHHGLSFRHSDFRLVFRKASLKLQG